MSNDNKKALNCIYSSSARAITTTSAVTRSFSCAQTITMDQPGRRVVQNGSVTRSVSFFTRDTLQSSNRSLPPSYGPRGGRNSPSSLVNSSPQFRKLSCPATSSGYTVAQDAKPFGVVNALNATRSPARFPTPQSLISEVKQYDLSKPACVVIFHHVFKKDPKRFREGSQHDLVLIKDFLQGHNAKIKYLCEDYKVKQVRTTMNKIRQKNFDKYSCLIVIIMSHGESNDQIQALDKCYNLDKDIVDHTRENKSLLGKPKLFIVQACKGDAEMESDCDPKPTAPNAMDIFKCFSTYEGTLCFRDIQTGSFFIQAFFKLLLENRDKEISDIMRMMRCSFFAQGICQAPTETSTLTKQFFFRDLKKN